MVKLFHDFDKSIRQTWIQTINQETWTAYFLRFLLVPLLSIFALFAMAGCLALGYGFLSLFR